MAEQTTSGEEGTPGDTSTQSAASVQNLAPAPSQNKVGFGVTALVLGIVGIFLFWIPLIGLIPPVLAVVFGCVGIYLQNGRGMAVAGLVLGIVTFALTMGLMMFSAFRT